MRGLATASLFAACVVLLPAPPAMAQSQAGPGDDDVMRPTERGLRMNRTMARGMVTMWLMNDDIWKDVDLSDEQQRQIADATSRRMLDMADRDGRDYQQGIEYLFEVMMETNGHPEKLGPERSREFGQKMIPLARAGKEFVAGVTEDARAFLRKDQMDRLQAQLDWASGKLDNFERRLQNWVDGRYQEGENPFHELESEAGRPGETKGSSQQRQARRVAEWELRRISVWEWSRLLAGVGLMFKFDAGQRAKGEVILAGYRKKADAIMTPQWRERMLRNRMKYNAQWQLGEVPKAPWIHQLDAEYAEASKPLRAMTESFIKELLALPTAEQRAAAIENIRATAEQHGLAFEDSDVALLWLTPQEPPPAASAPAVEGENANTGP